MKNLVRALEKVFNRIHWIGDRRTKPADTDDMPVGPVAWGAVIMVTLMVILCAGIGALFSLPAPLIYLLSVVSSVAVILFQCLFLFFWNRRAALLRSGEYNTVPPQSIIVEPQPIQSWPLWLRFAFRFVCCYWLLYIEPAPIGYLWHAVVPWVAVHFFHITGQAATYFFTGSGDTTLAYVQTLLCFLISLAAAVIWTGLDKRRPNYIVLHGWLRLMVRYTLAWMLFSYGFSKVFPVQFPRNSLLRMIEVYGDFSPMGVVWSFMGASSAYVIFTGVAEVLAGLLLVFRRTTTLGAMVASAVMLNIVALNFCYDIPVKLYSTHLLLKALFLLVPDLHRLLNVLVLNRSAAPVDLGIPRFRPGWPARISNTVWVSVVGWGLVNNITSGYRQFSTPRPTSPLYGLYRVEKGGSTGWQKVAFDSPEHTIVRMADDTIEWYDSEYDTEKNTLSLKRHADFASLVWSRPDPLHLILTGTCLGDAISINLRKIDGELLLTSRGFHWINEMPFNR